MAPPPPTERSKSALEEEQRDRAEEVTARGVCGVAWEKWPAEIIGEWEEEERCWSERREEMAWPVEAPRGPVNSRGLETPRRWSSDRREEMVPAPKRMRWVCEV